MKIYPCKYAFDKEDEYCCSCNGVKLVVGEAESVATRCHGYEADTNKNMVETDMEEIKKKIDEVIEEPEKDNKERKPPEPYVRKEDREETENTDFPLDEELPFDVEEKTTDTEIVKNTTNDNTSIIEENKNNEGVTTKLIFMSGATISRDNGNTFYKFECTEERIVTPDMNVADEREKLWATINSEIDKQIEDVFS